jgi:hypothetical protein
MKLIVPSMPRTGASLVVDALKFLLDETSASISFTHQHGRKISNEHLHLLKNADGIVQTHSIHTPDFLGSLSDLHIISPLRDFLPTLCSYLLYQKNVCSVNQSLLDSTVANVLSALGKTTDIGFLNIFIESNFNWVKNEARKWRRACVVVLDPKVTQLKFELMRNDYEYLWYSLTKIVSTNVSRQDFLEQMHLIREQKHSTPNGLLVGGTAEYKQMLDNTSKAIIEVVLEQVKKEKVL